MPIIKTRTYKKFQQAGTRVEYRGPDHTDLDDDVLVMQSSDPTRTRTSFGNRRSYATMVRGITTRVRGSTVTEQTNASIKIVASIPAGATEAEIDALMADFSALATNVALLKSLIVSGQIDQ